jgi:hypothetical protein
MENYNLELLNKTYLRIVNVLEKNSDLKIYIGDIDNLNSDLTEICIIKQNYVSPLMFNTSVKSTEEDNKYSFLLCHKYNYYDNYIGSSIFKYAEICRNYYQKHYINDNSISYELYFSEAGKIIKDLGFPCCLEELMIKMDLMGV